MKLIDISGKKYGKLTVIERCGTNKNKMPMWKCRCDCGNEIEIDGRNLRNGTTLSCGCSTRRSNNARGKKNRYELNSENNNETFLYDCDRNKTIVDTEDVQKIKRFYWRKNANGYWVHQDRKNGLMLLHRFIMGEPKGMIVDHIFHDTSDNRKSMLRICTEQENQINRIPKKRKNNYPVGVYKNGKKFRATLRLKQISLREEFDKLEDAIAKRKEWEKQYLGEFAYKEK